MGLIFLIRDKTGRKIYLTKERWAHIVQEHPLLSGKVEEIKETLTHPLIVRQSKDDSCIMLYYRWNKERSQYLLVIARYLNGEGMVRTSFYVRTIQK